MGAIALHLYLVGPSLAQAVESQTIVVDGRPLFQVASAGELTAQERANPIQRELEELAATNYPKLVTIELRDQVPVILVNDDYLMSITQADAQLNRAQNPEAQAEILTETLQTAFDRAQAERQQGFLLRSAIYTVVALLLALVGHWLIGRLWQHTLRPLMAAATFSHEEDELQATGSNLLLGLTRFLARVALWLGTALYITNLFPLTRRLTYLLTTGLSEGLLARNLNLGERNYSVLDLLVLFAVLLAVVIVSSAATNVLRSRILEISGINRGSQEAVAILVKYTLVFLGAVVVLQIWGIDLSSLALIASALGVGIGLGLQNIAKDFVSGLIMVFERPIQVGDFLDFGEFLGTVERIGARSTEIRTLDHISIIVPNSRFLEQEVINWSHRNPVSRIRLPVGTAYGSDPEKVRYALLEACEQNSQILRSPSPQVFFTGFGDNALKFELLVWISQPNRQIIIKSDLYFAIEAAFRKHNIEVPFPQRDVHIRTGSLPIELSSELPNLFDPSERSTGD
ncbi:MAG: mechanosensitive ion channel [Cyanobacteria bacterium Co-bin13]|nr:mechanosensitive ion channel [Cyanobacteria bacterium Co-bin13]